MSVFRKILSASLGTVLWVVALASLAHAHGGMADPGELGPPFFTSMALGIVGYWAVMLWPSSKNDDESQKANRGLRLKSGGRVARYGMPPGSR